MPCDLVFKGPFWPLISLANFSCLALSIERKKISEMLPGIVKTQNHSPSFCFNLKAIVSSSSSTLTFFLTLLWIGFVPSEAFG
ncbi:hypothetical protein EYC80_010000 [Monilinia laxa]|uniref:Uncharacterized protein n=1 Tax=Monilinia laxa TaxID=61186 RepID=A0A5N6JRB2_MONLA|nr:hypothetical protein EYC80_010000 [Monilinia laxa]